MPDVLTVAPFSVRASNFLAPVCVCGGFKVYFISEFPESSKMSSAVQRENHCVSISQETSIELLAQ